MSESARIVFNNQGTSFEIAGSEEFVSKQVEAFRDLILKSLTSEKKAIRPSDGGGASNHEPVDELDSLPNLLHTENGNVTIIKTIQGGSFADKMLKVALIYILAKHNAGVQEVAGEEIRQVCKDQGCLDANNFAKTLAAAKQYILITGKTGGNKTYKLTKPGRDHAKAISVEENGS